MCSTNTRLREAAAKFIKLEDWVAHLECNAMSDVRVKRGNQSDPKPVSAPFFTPSSSSSSTLSSGSYDRAQCPSRFLSHSQSKPWISNDNHVIVRTISSTCRRGRSQYPIKVTDASCRYGMLLNTTEVNKCIPHNTIHVSSYNYFFLSN